MKFRVLKVKEVKEKKYLSTIDEVSINDLPEGNLLIKVSYSSINFKDSLSSIGNKGVTKNYPHTPGIDAVGEVVENKGSKFKKGDKVIITGYDLGMNTWGGYSEYIRVPEEWAIKLPNNLTEEKSMIFGTAGITAGMSVYELLNCNANIPKGGKILVSGATGGVGIISCLILVKLGYKVTAITSKEDKKDFLLKNGVFEVITRDNIMENASKPMLKTEYDGAIDVAGGEILDSILKRINYKGAITCCGLVNSFELKTNVFPFILRGVRLIGIDSVECSLEYKKMIWDMIAEKWNIEFPKEMINEISMEQLPENLQKVLKGQSFGRTLVKIKQ